MISKKVILTGSFGVGKTSLFNKFLYNRFSEKYLTTIGVKVDKRNVNIDGNELSMLLWDIAGEVSQDKVPHSYFLGTSGIIYVFDLTRPSTFMNMARDIEYLKNLLPGVSVKIVGNKTDLVTPEHLAMMELELPLPYDILTSAKTGDQVENLFYALGKDLITNAASQV
ncbi:MAG: small GTP-binding protein [Paraglaciecola sp.]|jgi:small GTP-binding protein